AVIVEDAALGGGQAVLHLDRGRPLAEPVLAYPHLGVLFEPDRGATPGVVQVADAMGQRAVVRGHRTGLAGQDGADPLQGVGIYPQPARRRRQAGPGRITPYPSRWIRFNGHDTPPGPTAQQAP